VGGCQAYIRLPAIVGRGRHRLTSSKQVRGDGSSKRVGGKPRQGAIQPSFRCWRDRQTVKAQLCTQQQGKLEVTSSPGLVLFAWHSMTLHDRAAKNTTQTDIAILHRSGVGGATCSTSLLNESFNNQIQ
jgi:hypothetical protein